MMRLGIMEIDPLSRPKHAYNWKHLSKSVKRALFVSDNPSGCIAKSQSCLCFSG